MDVCVRNSKTVILECTLPNSLKSLSKSLKSLTNKIKCLPEELLICGEYIYPLIQSCKTLSFDLWMEDPAQIKHSFGVQRGKSDKVDARRIAEYSFRYQDKAIIYTLTDDDLNSLKLFLSERDLLLADKVKYSS